QVEDGGELALVVGAPRPAAAAPLRVVDVPGPAGGAWVTEGGSVCGGDARHERRSCHPRPTARQAGRGWRLSADLAGLDVVRVDRPDVVVLVAPGGLGRLPHLDAVGDEVTHLARDGADRIGDDHRDP